MNHGCLGNSEHEDLVNLVRFKVMNHLRYIGMNDILCLTAESVIMRAIGLTPKGKSKKARKMPDLLLAKPNCSILFVEIGCFNPDKWGTHIPVLHIGFNQIISLVNPSGTEFEQMIATTTETMLYKQFGPPIVDDLPETPDVILDNLTSVLSV